MNDAWIPRHVWLLAAPLIIVTAAVIGYPLIDTIRLAFTDARLIGTSGAFVGPENFTKLLSRRDVVDALLMTSTFAITSVAAEVVLGVLTALLLQQNFRGRTLLRALMILPWALPTVVNAMLWRLIYHPEYGALNAALVQMGFLQNYQSWLGQPSTAIWAIVVAYVWKNFSLVTIISLAALQAVPQDVRSAALIDGAGALNRFRYVTLPYLVGPLMVALVLRTIEAFKVFDIIWVMTRGGPANTTRSLSLLVYQEAFSFQRAGSGASLALIVTFIITALAVFYTRLIRQFREKG